MAFTRINRKFPGSIKVGMLLIFYVFTGPVVIGVDVHDLNFIGQAPAQSYQSSSHEHLERFDHIILTWAGNPATTQAVTWRSHVNDPKSIAEIAPATASPDFVKSARRIWATTSHLKIKDNVVYYHSVNFTGLHPNTLYAYRVGNGNTWSEWFQFRTADSRAAPFSFLYFGDAQDKISSLWSRVIRAAILNSPEARFMIHAGDMVNRENYSREWDEWFYAGGWVFATIPSVPAIGNHEYLKGENKKRTLSKYWRPQFTLPKNGIPELDETFYHLDYQGVRLIVLNSNKKLKQQARWLESVLKHNPNFWTVVVFHHPVWHSILGRDNKMARKYWQPLFDRFKVDLILQGHDHVYTRGHGPGKTDGPVYVTSVSGNKMYNLERAEWMDRASRNMQLFQVISISKTILSYKSITVTGEIYDAFDLIKENGKSSKLINRIPIE